MSVFYKSKYQETWLAGIAFRKEVAYDSSKWP